jgi:iron complex outermembrane receptor protein
MITIFETNSWHERRVRAAIVALAFGAHSVLAGPTPGTSDSNVVSLDEIVVTAQKRSQSINDVPMSITAATGEALLEHGITDTADLGKLVPGFTSASSNLSTPV